MINVLGPDEVTKLQVDADIQRAMDDDAAEGKNEAFVTNLASYVRERWERAARAKVSVENQMLTNLRQKSGVYDSMKLAAIKKLGGSQTFVMLTDTKCRTGVAWTKDILFQPGTKPWSIEPTPKPELPPEIAETAKQNFLAEAMKQASMELMSMGLEPDQDSLLQLVEEKHPDIEDELQKVYQDYAKKLCKKEEIFINDQLTEGGWYFALEECLEDIVSLKAGVLKGPIIRSQKTRVKAFNQETGAYEIIVEDKIVPVFERRSPFNIYPAADSTGVDDSYLFDKITLSRKQLYDMIKLPGFDEAAIRSVLQKHSEGSLKEWTSIDSAKADVDGKDSASVFDTDKIDCLEFWDEIPGHLLLEWGLTEEDVPDPDDSYPSCVWMIGTDVVKAMMNYDQFGNKPFSVTSFELIEDSFWGKGVPELIADIQGICNAIVRAIVNNVGIASGPQVEINKQRVAPGFPMGLHPWKVWETTDMGIATAPALKIYNIPLNADNLIQVYSHFSKMADEHSGIPGFAHGDSNVAGAGQTASGLSMLMTGASRGIKSVIRNIDNHFIARSIEKLYYFNMDYLPKDNIVFDMKVVARGSSSLIAKEQQAVRLTEFLQTTNNPVDLQIMGLDGRKNLLLQAAKASEIETDRVIPERPEPIPTAQPAQPQAGAGGQTPGAPLPGPQTTDAAGNAAQGQDTRLFPQDSVPQMRT